ncbi:hypothetical protein SOCE26_019520 [Sorangium cellulosum]|uniref:Secreted protein n=1 Tax=Sorangium cellulosum TaxID=56 RepID=A0A2L0EMM1_SORCE|nr:hypothetical protein SOCE26_019520 [Sorangium cellulosum]
MHCRCVRIVALLAGSLATTGCIGAEIEEDVEDEVDTSGSTVLTTNGYLANALSPNALSPNALSPNALSPNALSPSALSPGAVAALKNPGESGDLARQLLRYIVGCALRPDQTFSFSWIEGRGLIHREVYRGELGLAPWWAADGLEDGHHQRLITACIASRANWYGVSVMVSLRNGETPLGSQDVERAIFPVREGAFWGNLFGATPYARACYAPQGVEHARKAQRDCAAGHVAVDPATGAATVQPCGPILIAGSCDELCTRVDMNGGYYSHCLDDPWSSPWVRTDVVITSYLTR